VNVTVAVRNTGPAMFARLKAKAPAAISRSLNRAAVSARTVMVPAMAKDLGVKQSAVKDGIRTVNATPARQVARLAASLKRLSLYALGAKGPVPSRGKGRGVTVRGKRYPHAFIATVGSGRHTGVFQRKTKARLPIRELLGASLGRVFIKYRELGRVRALEALAKNLQAEFKFALTRS
jgi:hypothetical protein